MATYRSLSARKPRGRGHERRDEILASAESLIGREGAEISMREIAAGAGLSQAALFKHFANRPALISAMRGRVYERLDRSIGDDAQALETPRGALEAILRAHARLAREQPSIFSLLFPTPAELAEVRSQGAAVLPGLERLRAIVGLPGAAGRSLGAQGGDLLPLTSWFSIYGMALAVAVEIGRDRLSADEMVSGFIELLARQLGVVA